MKLVGVLRGFPWIWTRSQMCPGLQKMLSTSSNTSSSDDDGETSYDVIISGGGIVGSTLAYAFTKSPILNHLKVLFLEAAPGSSIFKEPSPDYSNRVSTINQSSIALLDHLGVWSAIRSIRAQPVMKMHVWEACSDSFITYDNEGMRKEIAFVIENDAIVRTLARQLKEHPGNVDVAYGSRAVRYTFPSGDRVPLPPVRVELHDGRKLKTSLLIGADGPGSLVRKTMDVKYLSWSYKQEALVATLELAEPTDNVVAWQRFLPTGPIALLPLSDTLSSLVWTNTPENCKRLLSLPEDEFVDALNHALWNDKDRLGWMEQVMRGTGRFIKVVGGSESVRQLPPNIQSIKEGSRASFPLALGHSSSYFGNRVVLVGDAAHRVHPLAGLGVNLGLGDVAELIRTLETAVYDGSDVGSESYLTQYESRRQRHVVPTMAAIDGLHRLYTTKMPLVVLMRSVGLQLTDSCPLLKDRIIAHASS